MHHYVGGEGWGDSLSPWISEKWISWKIYINKNFKLVSYWDFFEQMWFSV